MNKNRSEDEWFAKHERDMIADIKREKLRREQRVAEALKQEEQKRQKELHWMRCPECGSNMVEEGLKDNAQIDRCTRCGGLFFDRGELEDILLQPAEKRKSFRVGILHMILPSWKSKEFDKEKIVKDFIADRDQKRKEVESWLQTDEGKKQKELHLRKCPKCGSDLKEEDVSHGLLIDDCTLCRGIYLNYGELESISELNEADRKEIRDRILATSFTEAGAK